MLNFYKNYPYNNDCSQKKYQYNQTNFQQNRQTNKAHNDQASITHTDGKFSPPTFHPSMPLSQKAPPPPPSISKPPPPPCKPPKRKNLPPKKKFNFKSLKKDTCTSLNDVECFLNNFSSFIKYIKLINLLK